MTRLGVRRERRTGLRRIFVVFKTHFDIGFTGLVDEVLDLYARTMIPKAVEACRQTETAPAGHRFAWTLPAWPLTDSLMRIQGTPLAPEVETLVRQGRITWHALPFTTHTEIFGLEDFIRGMYVARALGSRFGRRAVAAKMTDVPGHTWILPTLLASAGVRFLHLGCNACSTPPDVPFLFLWEGPDGSRVPTMYSRGGYGTPLFPPPDWKLPIWLALQHTMDNAGPHRADAVDRILAEAHERQPGAEVVVGSLDDFALALEELKPDLPVVRKDLADSWIHGVGSMPREVARVRAARGRLVSAESAAALRALARGEGASPPEPFRAAVRAAYEKLLLFGEHTWGMDTKLALNPQEFGGRVYAKAAFREVLESGKYGRITKSWRDKACFAAEAEQNAARLESMAAGGLPAGPSFLPARLAVVNHHVWAWKGLLKLGRFDGPVTVEKEGEASALPAMTIDGETWVDVRDLPPLSATVLRVEPKKSARQASRAARPPRPGHLARRALSRRAGRKSVLENGMLRIEVDHAGGVTALVDKASGRNWVDRTHGIPFGAYRYDVFSRREIVSYLKSYAYDLESWFLDDFGKPGYPDGEHRTFYGSLAGVESEAGPGWARLRVRWRQDVQSARDFGNAAEAVQEVILYDDLPWVDMVFRIPGKPECPLLEAGHIVFPVRAERPRWAVAKTGSVIDPARDIAQDANRLLYCCERWVDVEDRGAGLLVIPRDSPLFSIGSIAIEKFDGDAGPGEPVLYFNLFNTQWGTNFPQWIGGDLCSSFRLVPHAGGWQRARTWEHAAAALEAPSVLPAHGARTGGPGGAEEADRLLARGLLEAPARGLRTVTIKHAEAGDGIILRLQEAAGRGGKRVLGFRIPEAARTLSVTSCSLLEEEQAVLPAESSGGSLRIELAVRPFQVITLKLKF